jgi:hypothetical protein
MANSGCEERRRARESRQTLELAAVGSTSRAKAPNLSWARKLARPDTRARRPAVEIAVAVVALLAVLFLVGRGTPLRSWPLILAATLAVVVAVVLLERSGYWPASWRR